MAKTDTPIIFKREDYRPPNFSVDSLSLDIELNPSKTIVNSTIKLKRLRTGPLLLKGEGLELLALKLDGKAYVDYTLANDSLELKNLPDQCTLEISCSNQPDKNTSLMGLYVSRGNFFTQCEAEGFRKITYFLDQPDVLTKYLVTLKAKKADCPVLLSNGNLIASKDLADGWHSATWEDPFPKPSYLFALVAGKLSCLEKTIVTNSGKTKLLQVWVEETDLPKANYAMESLIKSIKWDEERFGLELDLERFMIVAVSDFNMGAMENKGLNIFNTKYVLADADSATDIDFANIESVVGHEYFHNWTGNRVTCRDWFQLSLKEGLTVFRDQEFSADLMGSASGRSVKRIEDVRLLRQLQFPEDAGPMAHPIRPDSYQEINNFYTVTVYEKGSEVVRMQHTLLGEAGFRKGIDLYFKRHDGQAVTCDDFVAAMADANEVDLEQFKRWYSQAGTPRVKVTETFNEDKESYTLTLHQTCPATPGQSFKEPFLIPLLTKLIGIPDQKEFLIQLKDDSMELTFNNIRKKPILSINRNFSAPIILEFKQSIQDLIYLFENDDDSFNRWEAGQKIAQELILKGEAPSKDLIEVYRRILEDDSLDPAFRELALTLPSETYLHEQVEIVDPQSIFQARQSYKHQMAIELKNSFAKIYKALNLPNTPYSPDAKSAGQRALKNFCLQMIVLTGDEQMEHLAFTQFKNANNMTDRSAALSILVNQESKYAKPALEEFYLRYQHDDLVIDKWFAIQSTRQPGLNTKVIDDVLKLKQHPAFHINNPNRARSLIHAFCMNNPANFHAKDGSGYDLWINSVIELNKINPQVAARLARALDRWRKFSKANKELMHLALQKVAQEKDLSPDVQEVISKALH